MRLQVKGKNVEVSDAIRAYAQEKLAKLDRQLTDPRVELELAVERNPSIADAHVAEATVFTRGPVLRARESSQDMKASIDQLVDKLERQVTRYREKRQRGHHQHARANGASAEEAVPLVPGEEMPQIVKTKQFIVKPMTPEEAVLQLELVGHDFFVFRNSDTDELSVVYRRNDGDFGLIEPQGP
jgi:putative sigma-54 modulation protein